MLESQRIQMRMSETREAMSRCAADTPEGLAKFEKMRGTVADLERDWRAAVDREQVGPRADGGESRALAELHGRASVRAIVDAAVNQHPTEGAEAEAQAAARVGGQGIPWGMLAEPEPAVRADADAGTPSTIGETQRPILDRVFARSSVAALGVAMPSAGVGDELYYVTTAGAPGAFASGKTAVDSSPFTLSPFELAPKRLSAGYLLLQENEQRIRGYDVALRGDLRMALSDRLDKQILGEGDANVRGFLATAANGGLAARTTATTAATYELALAEGVLGVDGVYASELSECAWCVGDDTYRKLATLVNAGSGETSAAYHARVMRRFKSTANLPAVSNTVQQGIIAKRGARITAAIAPVWGGGPRIIRDEVTKAAEGQIRLTVLAFYNFRVLYADAYQRTSLKLS